MISTTYIASATKRLDLELKIIRHFLLHPDAKDVHDAFIATEKKQRAAGMKNFLTQKTDHNRLDDFLAPSVLHREELWLKNNLRHLKEFSENRLNQMELILRYTLFEGFLQKIVGNILWEYPELRKSPIHAAMKKQIRQRKPPQSGNPDAERIAWTKAAVDAVDRLPFDKWKDESQKSGAIYLWMYLRDAFNMEFPQKELWPTLERLRQIRNHVIHRSMEVTILGDRMKEAQIYLGNFPILLTQTAAKRYSKACICTGKLPDDEDDGTPAYVLLEEYG